MCTILLLISSIINSGVTIKLFDCDLLKSNLVLHFLCFYNLTLDLKCLSQFATFSQHFVNVC
jgi:hypothetical protein